MLTAVEAKGFTTVYYWHLPPQKLATYCQATGLCMLIYIKYEGIELCRLYQGLRLPALKLFFASVVFLHFCSSLSLPSRLPLITSLSL